MSDDLNPTIPPTENRAGTVSVPAAAFAWTDFNSWPPLVRHAVSGFVVTLVGILTAYLATRLGVPVPAMPTQTVNVTQRPAPAEVVPLPQSAFGWVDDADARSAAFAARPPIIFRTTPAGKTAMGDVSDVYLWRAVRKAAGHVETEDWYPNVNQQQVGCCVGCGWKHSSDVCQAVQVVRDGGEFRPLSVEVIYGASRVDVGKGQLRGDGSMGAWASEAVETVGEVAMAKYTSDDLTTFDPMKARKYGDRGVPADIKAEAKKHTVKATALVKTWADVQKAITQGYPVAVCSGVGFEDPNGAPGTRDKDGFCRARGEWPHCMCFIAVRGGDRPGAFCLNSWGDDAHHGPRVPADAPAAGFWVDAATVGKMVGEGDSFSLSDLTGFEARKLDWLIDARPDRRANPFELVLAP